MEQFKINNFLEDCPNSDFPEFMSLEPEICTKILQNLYLKIGLGRSQNSLKIFEKIHNRSDVVSKIKEPKDFILLNLLNEYKINHSEELLIHWYRFDDIDRLQAKNLSEFFEYLWYPAADDIEIFDDGLKWILSIHHSGEVRLLKDF
jgi:hypothetical protein